MKAICRIREEGDKDKKFRKVKAQKENTGRQNKKGSKKKKSDHRKMIALVGSGSYLFSQLVSKPVPSAYKGLTSVFGMGTGGTP